MILQFFSKISCPTSFKDSLHCAAVENEFWSKMELILEFQETSSKSRIEILKRHRNAGTVVNSPPKNIYIFCRHFYR